MIRVASWPAWHGPNPYLERQREALLRFDVETVSDLPLDWRVLASRQERVHAVHLHWAEWSWQRGRFWPRQAWLVGALRRFLNGAPARGIPVVWTVHNLTAHEPVPIIDRAGFQALHRRAALRVFHSRWARDAAVARFAGGATLVAPHPNYDGVFPPARPRERTEAELGLPPGRTLLLCFGGIRHYKGFDVAIEAMRHLRGGRFHLLIIGRGPSRVSGRLRALAGARTDITLLLDGPASDQLVADAIAASDVVLLPYREVTTSGALLAALTLSRGVIASDLPYFREVLSPHGQAGEFAAPGDAAALAAAIEAYGAVDIATRGRAARAIADRCPISAAVQPLADWLRSTVVPQGASAVPT